MRFVESVRGRSSEKERNQSRGSRLPKSKPEHMQRLAAGDRSQRLTVNAQRDDFYERLVEENCDK